MHEPSRKERRTEVRESDQHYELFRDEQRKFTRVPYDGHLNIMTCDERLLREEGNIQNVSQYGVLIRVPEPPAVDSLVSIRWDESLLDDVIHVNKLVHEDDGQVLGKVVRVHACEETNDYEVAIHFLEKGL